jgi:hypothetical protein
MLLKAIDLILFFRVLCEILCAICGEIYILNHEGRNG